MTAVAGTAPSGSLQAALACPQCQARVAAADGAFRCDRCGLTYAVINRVIDLRPRTDAPKPEELDWTEHWSGGKQDSLSQRFFSFYRKAVFAKAVAYFVNHYLAPAGLLVEAGSGTSETSMLIDKRAGRRTLAALDLIRPVLEQCHPVMDARICGDIFRLPFLDQSVDGIWNVGVMEHFTHPQIDAILKEFRRVVKPGGRIVLLWPAKFSIPQRILRILEWFINLRRDKADRFRFHPDEISQLRSRRQGKEVLTRNGFRVVAIDMGLRTGMAFETLVGER
jgi:ubiquinone/menaquinone biosynthesis C-methylase UbiE